MYNKMYVFYNNLAKQVDGKIYYANNDKEAEYYYQIRIEQSKKENPYFKEEHFSLMCVGIINMKTGEIVTETAGDVDNTVIKYPVKWDDIPNFYKDRDGKDYMQNISTTEKKEIDEIKKNFGINPNKNI